MKNEEDMLMKFGKIIDEQLKNNEVKMLITLPKGSMDAEVDSSYGDIDVMNLYILLYALKKVDKGVIEQADVDETKLDEMLEGMFDMVKKDILEDYKDEKNM